MFLFVDLLQFGGAVECMGYNMHDRHPAFSKTLEYGWTALSNDSQSQQ